MGVGAIVFEAIWVVCNGLAFLLPRWVGAEISIAEDILQPEQIGVILCVVVFAIFAALMNMLDIWKKMGGLQHQFKTRPLLAKVERKTDWVGIYSGKLMTLSIFVAFCSGLLFLIVGFSTSFRYPELYAKLVIGASGSCLLAALIFLLIALESYDTLNNLIWQNDERVKLQNRTRIWYIIGWYLLLIAVLLSVSFITEWLTLAGSVLYIILIVPYYFIFSKTT